jgi:hypothetical protein
VPPPHPDLFKWALALFEHEPIRAGDEWVYKDCGAGCRPNASSVDFRECRVITFRTSTEVKQDRRVVLTLPPETPMGEAELMVTIASRPPGATQQGNLRGHFGAVHGGDALSANNDRIEADLAAAYEDSHDEGP